MISRMAASGRRISLGLMLALSTLSTWPAYAELMNLLYTMDNMGWNPSRPRPQCDKPAAAPQVMAPEAPIVAQPQPVPPPRSPRHDMNIQSVNNMTVRPGPRLAHGPSVRWNGCDKNSRIRGGYGNRCQTSAIHPSFARNMDRHFFGCVQEAAIAGGYREPAAVYINHWGVYNNRRKRGGGGLSTHAYARAMDIASLRLIDASGKVQTVRMHGNDYCSGRRKCGHTPMAKFYDKLRACWKKTIPASCSRSRQLEDRCGSDGISSSRLGGLNMHWDHLHLTFPRCAG